MKNKNYWFIVSIILFLVVLGLGGFIIYDKVLDKNTNKTENNEIKDNEKDAEKEINKIGSLGSQSTKIEVGNRSMINVTINEDGTISGTYHAYQGDGLLTFNGITGKVIRVVKTYTCADDTFDLAVLSEDGNMYIANVSLSLPQSPTSIEFTKVDSQSKILGIDTVEFEGETTCDHSLIIAYKEDGKSYVAQIKTAYTNDYEFVAEKDENGNLIYEVDVLYEDYKNSISE